MARNRFIPTLLAVALAMGLTPQSIAQDSPYADKPAGKVVTSNSVYFESGSGKIVASGQSLLDSFVENHIVGKPTHVHLIGHSDTLRPEDESMALSQFRVLAVANSLREIGVDPSRISIEFLCESRLAKTTRDGIREPLNNRVEMMVVRVQS